MLREKGWHASNALRLVHRRFFHAISPIWKLDSHSSLMKMEPKGHRDPLGTGSLLRMAIFINHYAIISEGRLSGLVYR